MSKRFSVAYKLQENLFLRALFVYLFVIQALNLETRHTFLLQKIQIFGVFRKLWHISGEMISFLKVKVNKRKLAGTDSHDAW